MEYTGFYLFSNATYVRRTLPAFILKRRPGGSHLSYFYTGQAKVAVLFIRNCSLIIEPQMDSLAHMTCFLKLVLVMLRKLG